MGKTLSFSLLNFIKIMPTKTTTNEMQKKLSLILTILVGYIGFSQIPNLPTTQTVPSSPTNIFTPTIVGLQTTRISATPSIPENFVSSSLSNQDLKNRKIIEEDFKRVAKEESEKQAEQAELERQSYEVNMQNWISNGRNMSYNLPSFSGKTGTQSYYNAFDKLSAMDSENYSLAEVNFTVENAFYNNKQDFTQFKSNIQKTAKQLLQKMRNSKQDTESNIAKNLMLFDYFSKDMNLGGTNHKAFKYDFKDYFGEKDWSKMFVSKLLKTGSGQCHSMPLYYLILAEALGTEAYLSLAPNHSYIRFKDDDEQMRSVELTNGMFSTNTFLLESGYIKSEALQNKIYMENLTKRELLGMAYFDLARGYVHKYGYDEFVGKVLDKALELYPNGISPNMEKANLDNTRFLHTMKQLGINPNDNNDLQKIGYFPMAVEQLNRANESSEAINRLGYTEMPASAYETWLGSLKKESSRQESEAIAEKIKQMNAELQRKKQQEIEKKLQEEKRKAKERKIEEGKNKRKELLT